MQWAFIVNSIAVVTRAQSLLAVNNEANGISDENFKLHSGPRHDEFDWSLTKVSKVTTNAPASSNFFFLNLNNFFLLLQKVLNDNDQNTVVSPFLVKLLLSILAEAAGVGSSTHREMLSVLPNINKAEEIQDLYAKPFVALLVSLKFMSAVFNQHFVFLLNY